ncbi:MAG: hypothetical protein JNK49_17240 [Planctomycetes bacterium]|nr:hypothetical protein [Planctomycetota bacterium]
MPTPPPRSPWLLLGTLSTLGACASTPWLEPTANRATTWRHCRVFESSAAMVLAREPEAALELHHLASAAAAAIAEATGLPAARGLVLAIGPGDPLFAADPLQHVAQVQRWHAQATGAPEPPPPDADPAAPPIELLAPLTAGGVPKDANDLALPADLLAEAAFVVVLPSERLLRENVDRMVEAARKAHGVPGWQAAALSMFGANPAPKLRALFAEARAMVLTDAWLAALQMPAAQRATARAKLGLPEPPDPNEQRATGAARRFLAEDVVLPEAGGRFASCRRPSGVDAPLAAMLAPRCVVDLDPDRDQDLAAACREQGKDYCPLRYDRLLPDDAALERLAAVIGQPHYGGVLFCATQRERAAAVLACYAFHREGATAAEARALAVRHGAGALLPALEARFAAR